MANKKPQTKPLLQQANELINGQRARDYGSAKQSFTHIAMGANFVFAAKLNQPLTAEDIAMFLAIALKGSRRIINPAHQDSLLDMAGYVGLVEALASDEELPGIMGKELV